VGLCGSGVGLGGGAKLYLGVGGGGGGWGGGPGGGVGGGVCTPKYGLHERGTQQYVTEPNLRLLCVSFQFCGNLRGRCWVDFETCSNRRVPGCAGACEILAAIDFPIAPKEVREAPECRS
jgi:hypothetical protein